LKAREYAISLGLAKPGKGKLSFAAHAAIQKAIADGMEFTDYKGQNVSANRDRNKHSNNRVLSGTTSSGVRDNASRQESPREYPPLPLNEVTHQYNTVYGVDIRGRTPVVIAFGYCSKCIKQVVYCTHDIPYLPDWIGGGVGLVEKPSQDEAWLNMSATHSENEQNMKQLSETN
jgi:hypothetical protein